ncbi:MAG: hypothetical protein LBJ08_03490 [Bifidobacteriaceae bacterium]|nr:hypothetical protein [Bifidobacteriaceae bacterium]
MTVITPKVRNRPAMIRAAAVRHYEVYITKTYNKKATQTPKIAPRSWNSEKEHQVNWSDPHVLYSLSASAVQV